MLTNNKSANMKHVIPVILSVFVLIVMIGASHAEERVPGPQYDDQGQFYQS